MKLGNPAVEASAKPWVDFLKTYDLRTGILQASNRYPDVESVEISYRDVARHSSRLAEDLTDRPVRTLAALEWAIWMEQPPASRVELTARIVDVDRSSPMTAPTIRNLRAVHLQKLIVVRGIVRKVTDVRPKLRDAVFQCLRCTAPITVEQTEHLLREPVECFEDQGGCKRPGVGRGATGFTLLTGGSVDPTAEDLEISTWTDHQIAEIQELPDELRGGEDAKRLVLYLADDLAGVLLPGQKVTVTGILRERSKTGASKGLVFDIYLRTIHFERDDQVIDFEPSPEDEKDARELAADPNLYDKLVASVAPAAYGLIREKEVLLLQQFGGVSKTLPDGTRVRGDSHVLLVGDPGTNKSQLLRRMAQIAPRAILVTGTAATAVGLTAATVKEDLGDGSRWTLEAGALVLADGGLACVDEFDKMNKDDRNAMHEAMEQQTVSVAKAGITATLQARCSVLGAANPKLGRFDWQTNFVEQIELPPTLISRFDAILIFTDRPQKGADGELADHILKAHRAGRKGAPERGDFEPPIPTERLQRYIAYARSSVFPVLSDEAIALLRNYYVDIRSRGQGDGAVPMTARQLEGLIRLSEQSARARLSEVVTAEDAARAIGITEYWLGKIAGVQGGLFDADILMTGISAADRDNTRVLLHHLRRLQQGATGPPTEDDLITAMTNEGVPERRARDTVERLRRNGTIYSADGRTFQEVK